MKKIFAITLVICLFASCAEEMNRPGNDRINVVAEASMPRKDENVILKGKSEPQKDCDRRAHQKGKFVAV